MVNADMLVGKWHEVRGRLKERWGQLSDDELRSFDGNVERLVGSIQRSTGESREAIEDFLAGAADAQEGPHEFGDRIRQGAAQAKDTARHGYESLRQGVTEAERVVQDRPGQAVALAFGLGIAAGVGLSLWLLHEERQESATSRARNTAEQFGRQMLDALAGVMPHSE